MDIAVQETLDLTTFVELKEQVLSLPKPLLVTLLMAVHGFSMTEISSVVGYHRATIKRQITRAGQILRGVKGNGST